MSAALSLGASALALGLLGSPHCVVMCGAPCALLVPAREPARVALFHAGRALSYASVGALAGALGAFAAGSPSPTATLVLRALAGCALLVSALALAGLLPEAAVPGRLRSLGARVLATASRVSARNPRAGSLALGAAWGLVPCGLVYSAAVLALASGSALGGAATMAAFALGTSPALLAVHALAGKVAGHLREARVQRAAALALAVGALFNLSAASDGLRAALRPHEGASQGHCAPR